MRRAGTGHKLLVIATGIASLTVCVVFGVLIIQSANFLLGKVLAAVLVTCVGIWAAQQWWLRRKAAHQTKATDPIKLRMKQAAELRWRKTGEIAEDGQLATWTKRSAHFVRGEEEAVLWHKDAAVTLIRDYSPPTFADFIELEQWIKKNPRDPEVDSATGEKLYLRKIERFVTRQGYFESLLETTATDEAFFRAIHSFHKVGYAAQEDPVVVAGLTLEALIRYQKDRNAGLRFLSGLEKDIGGAARGGAEVN